MSSPSGLGQTFDREAERYDRARPRYPAALFDDLAALTGIGPGSRVLEIGPGTGIATLPLARLGCTIDAVEPGANLAAVARRNLVAFPDVRVHESRFEDFAFEPGTYDLVFAATAFHWIEHAVRFERCAAALRAGGHLAIVQTHHAAGGDRAFFRDAQRCYERWMPGTEQGFELLEPDAISFDDGGEAASEMFAPVATRRYPVVIEYTAGQYLDVLQTYSSHIYLVEEDRAALLACIARLIEETLGGRVRKQYVFDMVVSQRR